MPPTPKFIPLRRHEQAGSVAPSEGSWRGGGGDVAAAAPPRLAAPPPPSPSPPPPPSANSGTGKRSSKSPIMAPGTTAECQAPQEGALDDFLVLLGVDPTSNTTMEQVEQALVEAPEQDHAINDKEGNFMYIHEIGVACSIPLPRETTLAKNESDEESGNNNAKGAPAMGSSGAEGDPRRLFKTPHTNPANAANNSLTNTPTVQQSSGSTSLPDMELPPSADAAAAGVQQQQPSRPAARSAKAVGLTASIPADKALFVIAFSDKRSAQDGRDALANTFPDSVMDIVPRRRSVLNTTLVVKGVPFTTRVESLSDLISSNLRYMPSYVRLHRSERGVFKCVFFLKFPNRTIAEHSKLELERMTVGSRPLRVEYKKHIRDDEATTAAPSGSSFSMDSTTELSSSKKAADNDSPKAQQRPSPSISGNSGSPVSSSQSPSQALEAPILQLQCSKELEGVTWVRSELTNEDVRYLRHLCTVFDLVLEISAAPAPPSFSLSGGGGNSPSINNAPPAYVSDYTSLALRPDTLVTLHRKIHHEQHQQPSSHSSSSHTSAHTSPATHPAPTPAAQATISGIMDRVSSPEPPEPSPTLPPANAGSSAGSGGGGSSVSSSSSSVTGSKPVTPAWHPTTPGSLQPMEFRGISHWKKMRETQEAKEGSKYREVMRPGTPGSYPPWGAGRGRPAK